MLFLSDRGTRVVTCRLSRCLTTELESLLVMSNMLDRQMDTDERHLHCYYSTKEINLLFTLSCTNCSHCWTVSFCWYAIDNAINTRSRWWCRQVQ